MTTRLKQDQGSVNPLANAIVGGFQILDAKDKAAEEKLRYEQEQAYKARSQALQEKKEELIYDPSTGTYGPSKEKQEQIKTEKTLKDLEQKQKKQGLMKTAQEIKENEYKQSPYGRAYEKTRNPGVAEGSLVSAARALNQWKKLYEEGERESLIDIDKSQLEQAKELAKQNLKQFFDTDEDKKNSILDDSIFPSKLYSEENYLNAINNINQILKDQARSRGFTMDQLRGRGYSQDEISGLNIFDPPSGGLIQNQQYAKQPVVNQKPLAAPAEKNSKPKQVIQDGHRFILNEATGQYEYQPK